MPIEFASLLLLSIEMVLSVGVEFAADSEVSLVCELIPSMISEINIKSSVVVIPKKRDEIDLSTFCLSF